MSLLSVQIIWFNQTRKNIIQKPSWKVKQTRKCWTKLSIDKFTITNNLTGYQYVWFGILFQVWNLNYVWSTTAKFSCRLLQTIKHYARTIVLTLIFSSLMALIFFFLSKHTHTTERSKNQLGNFLGSSLYSITTFCWIQNFIQTLHLIEHYYISKYL